MMQCFLICSFAALVLTSCSGSSNSPSFTTVPPQKLSALGVPLAAYVVISTKPDKRYSLTLDSTTNSFKGEIRVKTGTTFDLKVIYTADDPVTGQTLEIAHYIRRGLTAVGDSMTVAYVGDESNWQTLFDLNPGSPNDLNLDGDAYFNFIEIGYGSDATSSASLPLGSRANGTVKDELTGSLDVGLPPPGSDLVAALRGDEEITIKASTPFDIKSIEIVSPTFGYEILSTDEEMIANKQIRVLLHTAQFVVGPEVGSMTLTVQVTDEYDLVRETTFKFAVYNLSGTCGNAIPEIGEECDDGNRVENDSCNSACLVINCGNGAKASGEECDDGNTTSGDGCDSFCKIEAPIITIVSPAEGATVKDNVTISASAVSRAGFAIRSLRLTDPILADENNQGEVYEATWNTRSLPEDQEITFTFLAEDTGGRQTVARRTVRVDNKPNVSFSSNFARIQTGESVTLSWSVTNANTVTIDNGVGAVASSGSTTVLPADDTTYRLTATRTNNLGDPFTTTKDLPIVVNHPPTVSNVRIETQTARTPNVPVPGNFKIAWDGSDPDGDLLEYDVTVTPQGEALPILDCASTSLASIVSGATNLAASGCSFRERAGYGEVFSPFVLAARTDYTVSVTVYDPDNQQATATITTGNRTIRDDNLVGWWRMDGDATDSSGNGNDGTLNGANGLPEWVMGASDQALSFDGVDDYVEISNNNALLDNLGDAGSEFSLELWFKAATTDILAHQQLMHKSSGTRGFAINLDAGSDGANFEVLNTSTGTSEGVSSSDVVDGTWHQVTVTVGGGNLRMYLDGRLEDASTYPANIPFSNIAHILLGTVGGDRFFQGTLDEVAIYNRALSVDDLRRSCRRTDPTGNTCPDPKEPIILTPLPNQILPPTRAYWSWRGERGRDGNLLYPAMGFEVKFDMDGNGDGDFIDGSDLLNQVPVLDPMLDSVSDSWYYVESRSPAIISNNRNYELRISPVENGTTLTQFESTRLFSTDNSAVAWWRLDDNINSGPNFGFADDSIFGAVNVGTLMNGLNLTGWTTGLLRGALSFDGVDDYVDITNSGGAGSPLNLTGAVSMTAWVNPAAVMSNDTTIVTKGSGSYGMTIGTPAGQGMDLNVYAGSAVSGEYCALKGPAAGVFDAWHFLGGAFDDGANIIRCQLDADSGSRSYLGSLLSSNQTLRIGGGTTLYFDGLIDEVIIYNRGLTSFDMCNSYLAFCYSADASANLACDTSCVGD